MDTKNAIEVLMRTQGYGGYILGCDEVGRGPLAGPATVACVCFPANLDQTTPLFTDLDDSKKLSARKRDSLVDRIQSAAAAYCIVDMTPQEIDTYNILQACLLGMKRACQTVIEKRGNPDNAQIHVIVDIGAREAAVQNGYGVCLLLHRQRVGCFLHIRFGKLEGMNREILIGGIRHKRAEQR